MTDNRDGVRDERRSAMRSSDRGRWEPEGDLRKEIKTAFEALSFTEEMRLEGSTGIDRQSVKAFYEGQDSTLPCEKIVAICSYLKVEIRARRRAQPKTEPVGDVTSLECALEVAERHRGAYFRGHEDSAWELVPIAFRGGKLRQVLGRIASEEHFLATEFRRRAPAILESYPRPDDHLAWLLYMRHFGTATRLLDWTTSALVAIYFSLANEADSDGQLWVLDPLALNLQSGLPGEDVCETRQVAELASGPFEQPRNPEPADASAPPKRVPPVAICPAPLFRRMARQNSAFTIHRDPELGLSLIDATESGGPFWYRIPANSKWELHSELAKKRGITRAELFPDLDGLSVGIRERFESIPVGRPRSSEGR